MTPRCDVCGERVLAHDSQALPIIVDGEHLADPDLWRRHTAPACEHPSRVGFGPIAARAVLDQAVPDMATFAKAAP